MARLVSIRARVTVALAGAALLAGCAGTPARGAGVAFQFVAAVAVLFSVGVVVLVGYLLVRLVSSLPGGDGG